MKSLWLDDHLALNLSTYDYHYTGLQVGAIVPVNEVPVTRTINAGAAQVYGVEGDLAFRPPNIAGLELRASAIWNHARFLELNNVPCWGGQTIAEGCNGTPTAAPGGGVVYNTTNESGVPLVRAPDFEATFGFTWHHPVANDMIMGVSSNTQYSSKYLTGLGYLYYQPSFFKTDLSLTLDGSHDRWAVAMVGKDLNDALTSGNCSNANVRGDLITGTELTGTNAVGPAVGDSVVCWMDTGRQLWLRLTLKWSKD